MNGLLQVIKSKWTGIKETTIRIQFLFLFSWSSLFEAGAAVDGKLTGNQVKPIMMKSNLPNSVLSKIWSLADVDMDGMLDEEEFCLAMYLIDYKLSGNDLPSQLPAHMRPPNKNNIQKNFQLGSGSESQSLSSTGITEETCQDLELG